MCSRKGSRTGLQLHFTPFTSSLHDVGSIKCGLETIDLQFSLMSNVNVDSNYSRQSELREIVFAKLKSLTSLKAHWNVGESREINSQTFCQSLEQTFHHQRWNTLQQFRSLNINIELFTFRLFLSSVVTMMMSAQISPKLRPKSLFEFKL